METRIAKLKNPTLPQFLFEWHPEIQKVYMIKIPGHWEGKRFFPSMTEIHADANVIAEHCETHAMFYGFVQTFCRGYKMGQSQVTEKNGVRT